MMIHSLEGNDAITDALNGAMNATIVRLVQEKLLTAEQGDAFMDHHVCILTMPKGGLAGWVARVFGKDSDKASIYVVHINAHKP